MGKSGQRSKDSRVIDNPRLRTPLRSLVEDTATVFLWALWVYFVSPVLTMILWLLGFKYFYEALFPIPGFNEHLFFVLKNAVLFVLIVLWINITWVFYNYRFIYKRLGERRKKTPQVQDRDFAPFLLNPPESLSEFRRHQRLNFYLQENKFLIYIPSGADA